MGRFRLRRLEKVNTEALMTAAGQNVKRLLAFGTNARRDRRRRPLSDDPKPAVASSMEPEDTAGDALGAQQDLFQQADLFHDVRE